MDSLYTIPDTKVLLERMKKIPEYMWPDHTPDAVVYKEFLTSFECDAIVEDMQRVEPYNFVGCGATTREATYPPEHSLDRVEEFARFINDGFFRYDLDHRSGSWMQTYIDNSEYQEHVDGDPGLTRKLTAVVMLSKESSYWGGTLVLRPRPGMTVDIPKAQGTICVFPPWIWHYVTPVKSGIRQTLNMGFWGPPFR